MKKSTIFMAIFAILFCITEVVCMCYAFCVHIINRKEIMEGIGWFGFGLIALFFLIGAVGFSYLIKVVVDDVKKGIF